MIPVPPTIALLLRGILPAGLLLAGAERHAFAEPREEAGASPVVRTLPVTLVTDAAFRELPNWRGLARGAVEAAVADLADDAGLVCPVEGEREWEPGDLARPLEAVLAEAMAAVPPGDGLLAIFLDTPPRGLPGGERGYAFLGRPGFLVFASGSEGMELGRGLREQLAMIVRHELGHVFGIPHLRGANVMTASPEGRGWTYGELGLEILRANRGFRFESPVPFDGCALDTLRDVYLVLDERGEMEPALFVDLAWAYRARGDLVSSEALFEVALRRDRASRAARLGLAQCAVARKDTSRAVALAEELGAMSLPPRAQVELGALWIELRRFAAAESLLAEAVSREAIPEGWFNLGLARLRRGDGDGAARAFRRYLELAPEGARRAEVEKFLERRAAR